MTFEPSKCKAMTFSSKWNPTKRDLFSGSTKLAEKNELEILGVTVDCKLTWTKHVSNIAARARQKLGALLGKEEPLSTRPRSVVSWNTHHFVG